jgi:hypothetical protein
MKGTGIEEERWVRPDFWLGETLDPKSLSGKALAAGVSQCKFIG